MLSVSELQIEIAPNRSVMKKRCLQRHGLVSNDILQHHLQVQWVDAGLGKRRLNVAGGERTEERIVRESRDVVFCWEASR